MVLSEHKKTLQQESLNMTYTHTHINQLDETFERGCSLHNPNDMSMLTQPNN